jgi:RNA polymerase sigma factor (sigma-70 family)
MDQGRQLTFENDERDLASFQDVRPALLGMAYRMLGSHSDAEDVLQDVFLKWSAAEKRGINVPAAWLMTVCTRRCIDLLRSATRSRTTYIGPWLPEPVVAETIEEPSELSSTLETAFLTLLERVTPKERTAYLLHEIFNLSHFEVAAALDISESASRKIVSRAKERVASGAARATVEPERQHCLLASFERAIKTDDVAEFAAFLAQDVRLQADSGGKASSVGELHGVDEILSFFVRAREWWPAYDWKRVELAGSTGLLLSDGNEPSILIWFGSITGKSVSDLYILRNPQKLGTFARHLANLYVP